MSRGAPSAFGAAAHACPSQGPDCAKRSGTRSRGCMGTPCFWRTQTRTEGPQRQRGPLEAQQPDFSVGFLQIQGSCPQDPSPCGADPEPWAEFSSRFPTPTHLSGKSWHRGQLRARAKDVEGPEGPGHLLTLTSQGGAPETQLHKQQVTEATDRGKSRWSDRSSSAPGIQGDGAGSHGHGPIRGQAGGTRARRPSSGPQASAPI